MHEQLIKYIGKYSKTPLSENDTEKIMRVFIPKKLRKRQFLDQEGEISKYTAFIVKGAMRQYTIDEKGTEHITYLGIENWWTGDRESFEMMTPSRYFIDAWEDSDLLIITKEGFEEIFSIPAIQEMRNQLNTKNSIALLRRVNTTISLSAEDRYARLEKTYPEFLQRFPQHIIASYLGITKETLSRVRRKPVKK